jgi:hypothetical protein
MTDDKQFKSDKGAIDAANSAARTFSKDAGVKGEKGAVNETNAPHTPPSKAHMNLVCPQCGKATLCAEFPDQYETWIKCSSCGFFMGMSHDEWHKMENSPNISEKIRKMAGKQGKLKG